MSELTGIRIGRYVVGEEIGRGGMGIVYKAFDETLERTVALKFLPTNLQATEQEKARFVQEAKAAAALNHPNICTVISIEESDGRLFIVMEFLDGSTLGSKRGTMGLKQALEIGIQIAEGLAAAHEKGIVHRDIKPENIMLRKDGVVQIMDFGLAKLRGNVSRLTKEGSTVGTAGYMSPEQIQGIDADHRSDIFSLGVVLFELFTGQLPFKGVHETALAYEIVNVDALPLSSIVPDIDPALESVILECLEKDPNERTQSAKQVAIDLKRYRRESSRQRVSRITAARPVVGRPGPVEPTPGPSSAWKQRLLPILAVLLVVAAGTILWNSLQSPAPSTMPLVRFPIILPASTLLIPGQASVAISPDGKNIAYLSRGVGLPTLFLRSLDQFEGQPLPGTTGAFDPFFSPNGEWVAYFADGRLYKLSLSGGAPQAVCEISGFMRGGWWSEDDMIWFGHLNSGIYRVPASGGVPVEVTRMDSSGGEISHRYPQPLPDGKHVLFTVKTVNISTFDEALIVIENIETHERTVLMRGGSYARYIPTGHVLYARGSSIFAIPFDLKTMETVGTRRQVIEGGMLNPMSGEANYSVSKTGTIVYVPVGATESFDVNVVWIDRQGRTEPIIDSLRPFANGVLSPDGQRLAVVIRAANDDIWVYQIPRKTLTRLTFGRGNSDYPVWYPDGSRILFTSERGKSISLVSKRWDGSGDEEIVSKDSAIDGLSAAAFSPDGQYIAYGRRGDIWIMSADGKKPSRPYVQDPSFELEPSFSPDGQWLAYTSNESGKNEVYVVPFPERNGKWQVSTKGGNQSRWIRDGRSLVYLEGNSLMSVELSNESVFDYSVARRLLEFPAVISFLDPSLDGQRFVYGLVKSQIFDVNQINVVVNWFDELSGKLSSAKE